MWWITDEVYHVMLWTEDIPYLVHWFGIFQMKLKQLLVAFASISCYSRNMKAISSETTNGFPEKRKQITTLDQA